MSTTISLIEVMASLEGISHWDLRNAADRLCLFDGDSTGWLDHLVIYRPGKGAVGVFMFRQLASGGVWNPQAVHFVGDPPAAGTASGIGGYDLRSPADRLLAFDYAGSGKLDHLLCYRPGSGVVHILRREGNALRPVFTSSTGLRGGHVLSGPASLDNGADRLLAFDFAGSGRLDHLLAYRPGSRQFSIMRPQEQGFASVTPDLILTDLGGWALSDPADRLLAFDLDATGHLDHLVGYRPGPGKAAIRIFKRNADAEYAHPEQLFETVFTGREDDGIPPAETGIGTLDLRHPADRLIAFDYNHSGKLNTLLAFRPGGGLACVVKKDPVPEKARVDDQFLEGYRLNRSLRMASVLYGQQRALGVGAVYDGQLYLKNYAAETLGLWVFEPVDGTRGVFRIRDYRYGKYLIANSRGKGAVLHSANADVPEAQWVLEHDATVGVDDAYIRNYKTQLYLHCAIGSEHPVYMGYLNGKRSARWALLALKAAWEEPRLRLKDKLSYVIANFPSNTDMTQQAIANTLQQGIDKWCAVFVAHGVNVSFARVPPGQGADLTFSWGKVSLTVDDPTKFVGAVTNHNFSDASTMDFSSPASVVYNDDLFWKSGVMIGDKLGDLLPVTVHEIGHVLGLGHNPSKDSIMYFELGAAGEYVKTHSLNPVDVERLKTRYSLS